MNGISFSIISPVLFNFINLIIAVIDFSFIRIYGKDTMETSPLNGFEVR